MNSEVYGFIKADGSRIVNERGESILLKGVGLGNWMLPEGYMWKFGNGFDRPRRIEAAIYDLLGQDEGNKFWDTFYKRYITEADIEQMAAEGFNSVRLPINSRFILEEEKPYQYIEEHLCIIDKLIEWCQRYKLYVFLDLHGAPGGQTGANIDDSKNNHPDLFRDPESQEKTIHLWRTLAERYRDEWIVGGYDLLNEPLPVEFKQYNDRLVPVYQAITKSIREVDKRHMIILEGAHWATDFSVFNEVFDSNMVLQFHKYWNNPDNESIKRYLDKRDELNVPLWMGESGENSLDWFAGSFQLLEDHDISWCFWPWKKLDTLNTPCSINLPKEWHRIQSYLKQGDKPSKEEAEIILNEYLDNILFENCTYHKEVVNAINRRPPLRIPAEFFGYRGKGISYNAVCNEKNEIAFRRGEEITLKFVSNNKDEALSFRNYKAQTESDEMNLCVSLTQGEWVSYQVNCIELTQCVCRLRAGSINEDAEIEVVLDEGKSIGMALVQGSVLKEYAIDSSILISEGVHYLRVQVKKGKILLDWIEFV